MVQFSEKINWKALCDETQNLNDADSETFSVPKFPVEGGRGAKNLVGGASKKLLQNYFQFFVSKFRK